MSGITYEGVLRKDNADENGAENAIESDETPIFTGLKFYLLNQIPNRTHYVSLVKIHGGKIALSEKQADIVIADHARKGTPPNSVSWRFIESSAQKGELEDLESYRCHALQTFTNTSNPHTSHKRSASQSLGQVSARSKRVPFTTEDDAILIAWVLRNSTNGVNRSGNEIYKDLEAYCDRHTFQSWRDRWVKKLKHYPEEQLERLARQAPKIQSVEETRLLPSSTPSPPEIMNSETTHPSKHMPVQPNSNTVDDPADNIASASVDSVAITRPGEQLAPPRPPVPAEGSNALHITFSPINSPQMNTEPDSPEPDSLPHKTSDDRFLELAVRRNVEAGKHWTDPCIYKEVHQKLPHLPWESYLARFRFLWKNRLVDVRKWPAFAGHPILDDDEGSDHHDDDPPKHEDSSVPLKRKGSDMEAMLETTGEKPIECVSSSSPLATSKSDPARSSHHTESDPEQDAETGESPLQSPVLPSVNEIDLSFDPETQVDPVTVEVADDELEESLFNTKESGGLFNILEECVREFADQQPTEALSDRSNGLVLNEDTRPDIARPKETREAKETEQILPVQDEKDYPNRIHRVSRQTTPISSPPKLPVSLSGIEEGPLELVDAHDLANTSKSDCTDELLHESPSQEKKQTNVLSPFRGSSLNVLESGESPSSTVPNDAAPNMRITPNTENGRPSSPLPVGTPKGKHSLPLISNTPSAPFTDERSEKEQFYLDLALFNQLNSKDECLDNQRIMLFDVQFELFDLYQAVKAQGEGHDDIDWLMVAEHLQIDWIVNKFSEVTRELRTTWGIHLAEFVKTMEEFAASSEAKSQESPTKVNTLVDGINTADSEKTSKISLGLVVSDRDSLPIIRKQSYTLETDILPSPSLKASIEIPSLSSGKRPPKRSRESDETSSLSTPQHQAKRFRSEIRDSGSFEELDDIPVRNPTSHYPSHANFNTNPSSQSHQSLSFHTPNAPPMGRSNSVHHAHPRGSTLSRATSTTVSNSPSTPSMLYTFDIDQTIAKYVRLGYRRSIIMEALYRTTFTVGSVLIEVIESMSNNKGIPTQKQGVWTSGDDRTLRRFDEIVRKDDTDDEDEMLRRRKIRLEYGNLLHKHGMKEIYVRRCFLRDAKAVGIHFK